MTQQTAQYRGGLAEPMVSVHETMDNIGRDNRAWRRSGWALVHLQKFIFPYNYEFGARCPRHSNKGGIDRKN